jgi:hypothetical protein
VNRWCEEEIPLLPLLLIQAPLAPGTDLITLAGEGIDTYGDHPLQEV